MNKSFFLCTSDWSQHGGRLHVAASATGIIITVFSPCVIFTEVETTIFEGEKFFCACFCLKIKTLQLWAWCNLAQFRVSNQIDNINLIIRIQIEHSNVLNCFPQIQYFWFNYWLQLLANAPSLSLGSLYLYSCNITPWPPWFKLY